MIGQHLSHFSIDAKLGEGGMGEVYRATDERLGREVALKLLPPALGEDPERLARLQREARLLASLNHPNIASLHDVGEDGGRHFLVMELAEGETLAARLDRGPVPLREALGLTIQIARGLESAHERGIVHRDLKPANVVVGSNGTVKLLDFGLAKAVEDDPSTGGPSVEHSPTLTARATAAGLILGTAAYMSPEQARGESLDARTDIWSFGLVLAEMLTGQRLFDGGTVPDVLAAVLRAEIDWSGLPDDTPRALREVLRRTVERDADRRLHSIADARIVLEDLLAGSPELLEPPAPAGSPEPAGRGRLALWAATAFVLGAFAAWLALRPDGETASSGSSAESGLTARSFRQLTLEDGAEHAPALSPDGDQLLFVKLVGDQSDIYLQRVDGRNAINLTEDCELSDVDPSWSSDGSRIAYRSECGGGGIFVMGGTGESKRRVTDSGFAPAWSPDGSRLVVADEAPTSPAARNITSALTIVDVETGERTLATEHDSVDPAWSPDGRWIAFWGLPGEASRRDILLTAADGSTPEVDAAIPITADDPLDYHPVWGPDSRELFFTSTRGGTYNVWRIGIGPDGRPTGEPRTLTVPSSWVLGISLSADGRRLAFTDRNIRQNVVRARLGVGDDGGPVVEDVQRIPLGSLEIDGSPMLSPDGGRVATSIAGLPQPLIVFRPDGTGLLQLTDGSHRDRQPGWSPDGEWIAFQTTRFSGSSHFGLIQADGSGLRPLGAPEFAAWYPRWSPDGEWIAISSSDGPFLLRLGPENASDGLEALPFPGEDLNFWALGFGPDGRQMVGAILRGPVFESLATYSLDSRSYRIFAPDTVASNASFSGDGRRVVWFERRRIAVHDFEPGATRTLVEPSPGFEIFGGSVSADEAWISWLESDDQSDIWLAELGD